MMIKNSGDFRYYRCFFPTLPAVFNLQVVWVPNCGRLHFTLMEAVLAPPRRCHQVPGDGVILSNRAFFRFGV
jgi:hypothetical protein